MSSRSSAAPTTCSSSAASTCTPARSSASCSAPGSSGRTTSSSSTGAARPPGSSSPARRRPAGRPRPRAARDARPHRRRVRAARRHRAEGRGRQGHPRRDLGRRPTADPRPRLTRDPDVRAPAPPIILVGMTQSGGSGSWAAPSTPSTTGTSWPRAKSRTSTPRRGRLRAHRPLLPQGARRRHPRRGPLPHGRHRHRVQPRFSVSRIDIDRPGPTYTVDTLRDMRELRGADTDLFFITGADALEKMLTWHDTDELFELAHFIGVTRPGHRLADPGLPNGRVSLMEVPALSISSTECRDRVHARNPSGTSCRTASSSTSTSAGCTRTRTSAPCGSVFTGAHTLEGKGRMSIAVAQRQRGPLSAAHERVSTETTLQGGSRAHRDRIREGGRARPDRRRGGGRQAGRRHSCLRRERAARHHRRLRALLRTQRPAGPRHRGRGRETLPKHAAPSPSAAKASAKAAGSCSTTSTSSCTSSTKKTACTTPSNACGKTAPPRPAGQRHRPPGPARPRRREPE